MHLLVSSTFRRPHAGDAVLVPGLSVRLELAAIAGRARLPAAERITVARQRARITTAAFSCVLCICVVILKKNNKT